MSVSSPRSPRALLRREGDLLRADAYSGLTLPASEQRLIRESSEFIRRSIPIELPTELPTESRVGARAGAGAGAGADPAVNSPGLSPGLRFVGSGRGPVRCAGTGIVRSGGAGPGILGYRSPPADVGVVGIILGKGRLGGELGGERLRLDAEKLYGKDVPPLATFAESLRSGLWRPDSGEASLSLSPSLYQLQKEARVEIDGAGE